jgi:hypothetical protein
MGRLWPDPRPFSWHNTQWGLFLGGDVMLNLKAMAVALAILGTIGPVEAVQTYNGGGIGKGMPAVVSLGGNNLLMFVRGSDDGLWWRRGNGNGGGWTEFQSLGGVLSSAPSCVAYNGRAQCFVRGSDEALWTIAVDKDGANDGWLGLDGVITNQPGSAVASTDGETQSLYAFGRGSDGGWWIRERSIDPETELYPWKDWRPTLNTGYAAPGCAPYGKTGVDCYIRFPDNTIRELSGANYQGGPLSVVEGLTSSAPSAVSSPNKKVLRLFVRGLDDQLWMNVKKSGAWEGFKSLNVTIHSGPSCAWEADGDIWCGALEPNGRLQMVRLKPGDY